MALSDLTRDANKRDAERDDERAHVIFKIADGRDYCREEPPRTLRIYGEVFTWAQRQWAPRDVVAFAIEWW